jgi:ubiquinone/menaquinone biosynthesis C-methylase UbiE
VRRVLEPELMEDDTQARAYAEADFEDAHSRFVLLFREAFPEEQVSGYALDLGCGPGDIARRFARAFPKCIVHGIDGSEAMVHYGRKILAQSHDLEGRVKIIHGRLPEEALPRTRYDAVISNSLLHHLHDPQVLWQAVKRYAAPGAPVFVMDLQRPPGPDEARALVETYAAKEPEVLKKDFLNSFFAAFEPSEIEAQLKEAGLQDFSVRVVTDRHLVVTGRVTE